MVARVGDKIWLTDAQAGSLADARNEIARALVGKARILNELVAGVSMVPGEPAVIGLNPQGLVGLDMSGPPWGSTWRHPVCWAGGRGTDVSGVQAPARHIAISVTTPLSVRLGPWPVWIRPHERLPSPSVAPYSDLVLAYRARMLSGTGTISVVMRASSKRSMEDPREVTFSQALTATMTGFLVAAGPLVDNGGGRNWITVDVSVSAGSAQIESFNFVPPKR